MKSGVCLSLFGSVFISEYRTASKPTKPAPMQDRFPTGQVCSSRHRCNYFGVPEQDRSTDRRSWVSDLCLFFRHFASQTDDNRMSGRSAGTRYENGLWGVSDQPPEIRGPVRCRSIQQELFKSGPEMMPRILLLSYCMKKGPSRFQLSP